MDRVERDPPPEVVDARSLANLLIAFRSSALFYPTADTRRAWVERVLGDVCFDSIVGTHTGGPSEPLPTVRVDVVEFCLGHIGVRDFGRRLRYSFRNSPLVRMRSLKLADDDGEIGELPSSTSLNSFHGQENEMAESGERHVPQEWIARVGNFWYAFYDQLRSLTLTLGNTNDGYDARIEFARQFVLDTRTGLPGMMHPNDGYGLVSDVDCIKTLTSFGYLNKSMASGNAMTTGDDNTAGPVGSADDSKYPVYVFGSNYVWIRSNAEFTRPSAQLRRHLRPVFLDEDEVTSFTEFLVEFTGGGLIPDQEDCAAAAVEREAAVLTSMSRTPMSLQLAFALPDARFYTANLFYLRGGGESCATDFRYRREFLSNACQCENRLEYWRFSVSVAAFDGSDVNLSSNSALSDFLTDIVRAFSRVKDGQRDHYLFNKFTGLFFVSYTRSTNALGGVVPNEVGEPAAVCCSTHRWLSGHTDTRHWQSLASTDPNVLLSVVPQVLVVYRPVVSEAATKASGPRIFTNYKTFDDIVLKYVLLSAHTLKNGYANEAKGVAYKSGDNYWLFSGGGGEARSWLLREADRFAMDTDESADDSGGESRSSDARRELNEIFKRTFSAPSRLFMHAEVLSLLGFNMSGTGSAEEAQYVASLTFTHQVPGEEHNACTVICSSPTVVVDEPTGRALENFRPNDTLLVLQYPAEQDLGRVLHTSSDVGARVVKTVVSLDSFWPGVRAVNVSFRERALKHVNFVFFAATDGNRAVRRLTSYGLTELCRFNTTSTRPLLPQPVVYTLQRIFAHTVQPPPV